MKIVSIIFCCLFTTNIFAAPIFTPNTQIETLRCELYGLFYKITATFREQKISPQQVTDELKKITEAPPRPIHQVIEEVYIVYKDKTPDWIEGFFYGECVKKQNEMLYNEEEFFIPKKKTKKIM